MSASTGASRNPDPEAVAVLDAAVLDVAAADGVDPVLDALPKNPRYLVVKREVSLVVVPRTSRGAAA